MLTHRSRQIIAAIIEAEGGYSDHPSDRGGATMYGITEAVARANGYTGPMRDMPRAVAERIYARRYIEDPRFDAVTNLSPLIGDEVVDAGVNLGQSVAAAWLQRWLTAFNRQGLDYPDLKPDGAVGPVTLAALRRYLEVRRTEGEQVLFAALNCSQGHRYLELAEGRAANEDFLFGWVRARVLDQVRPL